MRTLVSNLNKPEVLETAGRAGDWASVLPLAVDVATAVARLRLDVAERYPA